MNKDQLLKEIDLKYQNLGEKPDVYLKGLLHAKPINYWDYIGVDTLLSLQKTRTEFKDESIFIMYHQVTELTLKMMIHELQQLVFDNLDEAVWLDKINRLNRYTSMLITSFDVMRSGMSYEDYNTFRSSLTPASGFQSAQFRYLEIYCTSLKNLINEKDAVYLKDNPSIEEYFDHIYWKNAGLNRETGHKSLTLKQFEEKYLESLILQAKKLDGQTLNDLFLQFKNPSTELVEKLKEFDQLYNVEWPLVHLKTAKHYLDTQGENKAATGGSEWKKYLHPKFQQRKFFPSLWSSDEKQNWGTENIESKH